MDDLKNVGESSYNPGDGTDQRVQSLVFMMMMMICTSTSMNGSEYKVCLLSVPSVTFVQVKGLGLHVLPTVDQKSGSGAVRHPGDT